MAARETQRCAGVTSSCGPPSEDIGLLKTKDGARSAGRKKDARGYGKRKERAEDGELKERSAGATALFLRVRTFVACLSLLQLVQVMGSGYSKSALTSIERRYRLTTFTVGVLQSCFHIGNLSVILFVSYYGSKWHRPRAIAIGSLLMAASSLISCVPQFIGERYNYESASSRGGLLSRQVVLLNFPPPPSQQATIPRDVRPQADGIPASVAQQDVTVTVVSNLTAYLSSNDSSLLSGLQRVANWTDVEELLRTLHLWSAERRVAREAGGDPAFPGPSARAQLRQATAPGADVDRAELGAPDATRATNDQLAVMLSNASMHQLCKPESIGDADWAAIAALREGKMGDGENTGDDSFLYVFIAVGSVLKGMGHSPLHPLGMSFIDDYASGSNSAVYIGVVSALSLLGPAFGFILGSLTTNIWVDSGWVNTTDIPVAPSDSVWVGAWWMGYLITGMLLVVATVPFCAFPRVIAKEQEHAEEEDEAPCVSCIKVYFSDNNALEDSDDREGPESAEDEADQTSVAEEETSPLYTQEYTQESTSKSMDFAEQTQHLALYSEAPRNANGRVVCRLGEAQKSKSAGSGLMPAPGQRRFRRSASAPAIHVSNKGRATRAYSIHHTECILNKGVWERTVGSLSNSPSTASLKDFAFTLKGLLRDPVFISITLGFVSLTSFLAASITYASKYMETQFDLSASRANLLNGCVNLPMAVVGNILGGWIIRRRNLTVKRTLNVVLLALLMTSVGVAILLFLGCQETEMVGLREAAPSSCIGSCACAEAYSPVCDVASNTTYRSACHAGCTKMRWLDGAQIFADCRCLPREGDALHGGAAAVQAAGATLRTGACPQQSCWKRLAIFVAVMGTASMTAGISSTPSTLTILKVVPPADKAFAIGIVFVFTRVLAWIPAPVYVGSAIDTACLLWINSTQDAPAASARQHCEIYDKRRLRHTFFGCTSLQLLLGCCFYSLALYLVTRRDKERGKLQPGDRGVKV